MVDKLRVIRGIVRAYFVAALAGSFVHVIEAAGLVGLTGWEKWSTPFMIDGLAIVGMMMRSAAFAEKTRRTGFRVQCVMGLISLVANVYAAQTLGGVIFGVGIVTLFVAAERLVDGIEGVQADRAREVKAKRQDAARKAAVTRQKNAQAKGKVQTGKSSEPKRLAIAR